MNQLFNPQQLAEIIVLELIDKAIFASVPQTRVKLSNETSYSKRPNRQIDLEGCS